MSVRIYLIYLYLSTDLLKLTKRREEGEGEGNEETRSAECIVFVRPFYGSRWVGMKAMERWIGRWKDNRGPFS